MEDFGKLLLRLTTAGLILFHGVSKVIHGVAFMEPALARLHLPAFVAYGVFAGEVAAPLLMIAGAWTRLAAVVVMINMVAAFVLEANRNLLVIEPTGAWGLEAEAFYFLTALVVALIGCGRYSLVPEKQPAA